MQRFCHGQRTAMEKRSAARGRLVGATDGDEETSARASGAGARNGNVFLEKTDDNTPSLSLPCALHHCGNAACVFQTRHPARRSAPIPPPSLPSIDAVYAAAVRVVQ